MLCAVLNCPVRDVRHRQGLDEDHHAEFMCVVDGVPSPVCFHGRGQLREDGVAHETTGLISRQVRVYSRTGKD